MSNNKNHVVIELNNPRTIRSWCLYDWANSVYTLTITTVVFPIYFSSVTKNPATNDMVQFLGMEIKNTVLYSYSLSVAFLLIAFINPLLSGIADYSGRKQVFMKFFAWMGSLACAFLFFFDGPDIEFGIFCFALATVGYAGSLVFYNAFLPEIVTKDRMDEVSARGYSYGYIGSVLLLIVNLIIILMPGKFGIKDDKLPSQIAFLTVGLWWFVFSLVSFRGLPKDKPAQQFNRDLLTRGYKEVSNVFYSVKRNKVIRLFLPAFFFYSMGFQTIMYLASIFAENELKIPTAGLITAMLLTQFIAIAGANGLAWFSKKYGNLNSILFAVTLCLFVCVAAYFVVTEYQFYALAVVVGLIMGGLQSISRSTFSKLIPPTEDHASYFSFYELSEKTAIVFGTASYGLILQLTGSMRNSALCLVVFFLIGLMFLLAMNRSSERPVVS